MLDTKLIAFLEGKDPNETYNYHNICDCGAAQFNTAVGRSYPVVQAIENKDSATHFDGRLERIAHARPWNFGAMLDRARKEFEPA